jgi:hypothetical protein
MRIGFNPNKDKIREKNECFHQVILPVYIPNNLGYFKDSFTILKLCLESLFKTCHDKTFYSIINNGSSNEVVVYLNKLLKEKKINELTHTINIGKINAVLEGIVGQKFKFVTITDADVLFLNNWQGESYKVFNHFPKTGAVCTTPSSKSFNNYTFNVIFDKLFSKELKFSSVKNTLALQSFAKSIGNSSFYNKTHLKKYLAVSNGDFKAVLGAGHFVTTYRFDIFEKINKSYTNYSLGGVSEREFLDASVIKKGLWRLSTEDNYTFHMGNTHEVWMDEVFQEIKINQVIYNDVFEFKNFEDGKILFWLKNDLVQKILYRKKIKQFFLQYKGLTKSESKDY